MADIEYFETDRAVSASFDHDPARTRSAALGNLVNWTGAVVSLGLVVGMGVWAWQLAVRDVSGVPVIEALEGPMRVPPSDPGGSQAPHQGLAVNRIAEGAEAEPVPDRLVLAPPPVDLDGISLASASIPEPARLVTPEEVSTETQALIDRLIARGTQLDDTAPTAPVPIEASAAAAPIAETIVADIPEPVDAAVEVPVIPASVPGVARSLRPITRPGGPRARATAPNADPAGPSELDPAGLAAGTRLVQLGAFDAPEVAREQWAELARRFPDYFADRARVIQAANSGGSQFYRLRAHGFADLDASRRFCAALTAQGAACIPVTVR